MSQINVIVKGTKFQVNKELLEKSGYFKDLFEIYDDNIEIDVMSPETFQIILLILEDYDIGKEIAFAIDFLRIEGNINLIKSYTCNYKGCDIIMLNEKYCDAHKCIVCNEGKFKGGYCEEHVCSILNCENKVPCKRHTCKYCEAVVFHDDTNVHDFCGLHKCKKLNCKGGTYQKYCYNHVCHVCSNAKYEDYSYCVEHKCSHLSCNEQSIDDYYDEIHLCGKHKCKECNKPIFENSSYCYYHLDS